MSPNAVNGSVRGLVLERLRDWYGVLPEQVADDRPLAELGVSSRDAVALAAEVSAATGIALPPTLLWEVSTLGQLERRVRSLGPQPRDERSTATPRPPTKLQARAAVDGRRPQADQTEIAVIGIGCRLPGGVGSPDGFWRLLTEGRDAIGTVPEGRWDGFAGCDDPSLPSILRHGGYLDDLAGFDAEFFGTAPGEAAAMDPQQRLLLEVAREALDHAAVPSAALAGSRTGVYVGISGNEYARLATADHELIEGWSAPGAALSIAANRLSYALDLRGPSVALDTACSSSLVAVHHAVRALAAGDCDAALAGGVNVLLSPAVTLSFLRAGGLAADGRCKAFSAAADGMVRAEGCALVVLKRLADAERDADRVLAVVTGSAVNSDGRSNGLLAPNAAAQQALLEEVYGAPETVDPRDLDYVEAHGTGTILGDAVEARALGAVLGANRSPDQALLIGSVKSNLGHLEAAAGVTGLIKTVLALHRGELPASLHADAPNPHIPFDALRLRLAVEAEPWPRYSGAATAGVSAFGFGGTNAHVTLREYRSGADTGTGAESDGPVVLAIDAPTAERLREDAADLAAWLRTPEAARTPLADVAHTLLGRLGRGREGAAIVVRARQQASDALGGFAAGVPHPALATARRRSSRSGQVWVFSGHGSQWPGMARRLLDTESAFTAAIDRLAPLVAEQTGLELRAILEAGAELIRPSAVQPVLFALQVALADQWRAFGIRPAAVIGHSMGEIAAATVAGALDEADAVRVIAVRSRLLDGLEGGAMAVVDRPPEEITALAHGRLPSVHVAVHSSPRQCVAAGSADDIGQLVALVTADGGTARRLGVSGAGHTPQIEPLLEPFVARLGRITPRPTSCPLYTTVHEDPRSRPGFDAGYWAQNLRRPVRFHQAVQAAAEDGHEVFVEVSPHPTQLHPIAETLRSAGVGDALVLPTLRRGADESVSFRLSLAALILRGAAEPALARRSLHPDAHVADVPAARWRHCRHWIDGTARVPAEPAQSAQPAAGASTAGTADRLRACITQVTYHAADGIGGETSLTDLGLDSLQAARILRLVQREFGVELPLRALLDGTVASIAALIDGARRGEPEAPSAAERADSRARPRRPLPRDATERLLARLWQSVSGETVTDVDATLERLAAEPALHGVLARAISSEAGWRIPVERLALRAGEPVTLAVLAERLRPVLDPRLSGPLRPLRIHGSRPPLYLIHPAGGSSAVYRPLARRLGSGQPVFGLERLAHLASVEERAAEYAREIRRARPLGPWAVGGWSYGGLVAQETARLLAEHGRVSALVLIDSVLPVREPGQDHAALELRRLTDFAAYVRETYGADLGIAPEGVGAEPAGEAAEGRAGDDSFTKRLFKALKQAVVLPPAVFDHQRDSYLDLRSGERHKPTGYPGRTLLYRATQTAPHTVRDVRYERDDEALGWDAYCPDLVVAPVPGDHLSLLDPPAVDVLARLLTADLHACAPR